jgi:hypothetical protein
LKTCFEADLIDESEEPSALLPGKGTTDRAQDPARDHNAKQQRSLASIRAAIWATLNPHPLKVHLTNERWTSTIGPDRRRGVLATRLIHGDDDNNLVLAHGKATINVGLDDGTANL